MWDESEILIQFLSQFETHTQKDERQSSHLLTGPFPQITATARTEVSDNQEIGTRPPLPLQLAGTQLLESLCCLSGSGVRSQASALSEAPQPGMCTLQLAS